MIGLSMLSTARAAPIAITRKGALHVMSLLYITLRNEFYYLLYYAAIIPLDCGSVALPYGHRRRKDSRCSLNTMKAKVTAGS